MFKPRFVVEYSRSNMYQIILIGFLLVVAWSIFHSFRGWSNKIIQLPAYNLSLIRKHIKLRDVILLQGFLTEDAKQEYDELYEYLKSNYDENTDIIMNDTSLSQIEECGNNIPVMFSIGSKKQYQRILNSQKKIIQTNYTMNMISAIQPMMVYVKKSNGTQTEIQLQSGDALILPNHTKYGFGKGTIDCFNYYK